MLIIKHFTAYCRLRQGSKKSKVFMQDQPTPFFGDKGKGER